MLKALLAGRGKVAVIATNGVVSAACGCGSRNPKDYDFVSQLADEQSFTVPKSSCDCGGTLVKKHEVTRHCYTHHADRVLRSQHRQTVRRMSV